MIALALLAIASAAEFDMHWYGMAGEDEARGGGLGLGLAVPAGDVGGELSLDVGALRPEAIDGHLRVAARAYPGGAYGNWRPSIAFGPGVRFRGVGTPWDTVPYAFAQVALDTPRLNALRLRAWVEAQASPGRPVEGRLGLAVVIPLAIERHYPRDGPPPPATVADAAPAPVQGGRAFIPHPVCRWVPLSALPTWMDRLPPGTPVRVEAPGYLPTTLLAGTDEQPSLRQAPARGSVVVAAYPGDVVRLGDGVWTATGDGVVATNLAPGTVAVEVTGNGRSDSLQTAVSNGYANWVRPAAPGPVRVLFAVSSADLDEAAAARISEVVAQAGDGRFEVSGSHSPEGRESRNAELATRRAGAVAAALVAAGLDPSRVTVVPPTPVDPELTAVEQRAAVIAPVLP